MEEYHTWKSIRWKVEKLKSSIVKPKSLYIKASSNAELLQFQLSFWILANHIMNKTGKWDLYSYFFLQQDDPHRIRI